MSIAEHVQRPRAIGPCQGPPGSQMHRWAAASVCGLERLDPGTDTPMSQGVRRLRLDNLARCPALCGAFGVPALAAAAPVHACISAGKACPVLPRPLSG
jgi:hypothetical protein